MMTAFDLKDDQLDDGDRAFLSGVRQHGWYSTNVFADEERPGFIYSTGFWYCFKAPEVIIFGLPQEVAHQVLWLLFERLEAGERFNTDQPVPDILTGYNVRFCPAPESAFPEYLGWNRWFYGGDTFEVLQLIFPDMEGRFPWENGVSQDFKAMQPVLAPLG